MLTVALQAALRAQRPIPPNGLAEIVREVTPSASCTTPTPQHLKEGYAHGIPSLHSPSPLSPGGGPNKLSPSASQREIEGVEWKRALAFQHESSVFALPAHLASAGPDARTMQQATAVVEDAPSDFLDKMQVLDLESHFNDALATLPDPDKEQVKKAFQRLDGADVNATAVSSAKWAFIRAELRVASTVVALVDPDVLKALHTAVVGPAEDVAAVERLVGLMAGIMVETPAALLDKIEQGWTQALEGVSEGAWGELLATCLRPALQREQFAAAVAGMTAEGEGGMSRALRHLSAVDRERVEEALEKLDDEDTSVAAVACAKCAITRVPPKILNKVYKALVGSAEDVAGLERICTLLKRCCRYGGLPRFEAAGLSWDLRKPEGVGEEVWSELLEDHLRPALKCAVFGTAVARLKEKGERCFAAALRRLPEGDRERVRHAFAKLDGADVDKAAVGDAVADSVEVMLQPRMLSESYKLLVARPYDVAALESHGWFMGACMRLNVVEHSGDVPSARVRRPKGVSDADWTGLLDDRLGRALFGRMRARMVADVEEHFEEDLKTLSEGDRKRISEAVSRVEDGTVNPDAVLSVECAFVRIGIGAKEDSFLALLQPTVLEETYKALVQQKENGVALKRHLNFMEKCMSMTPEVLMREMEEGWTKRPESISEEVCAELWRAHMRPAFEYGVRTRAGGFVG